jgi:hypothetical protein
MICAWASLAAVLAESGASGQDNRVPVAESRTEARQETVVRPEYVTELRDVYRTVYTPMTQYHWEARWHPFRSPNWGYHAVPHVVWQTRVEKTQVPVTSQRYVAETRSVQTPYLALRFAQQPQAAIAQSAPPSGISLAPGATAAPAAPAPLPSARVAETVPLGGILKMDSDPPRRGLMVR